MDDFLQNNPVLQGMPPEKLEFIKEFAAKSKPQNMKEAMPFLMASLSLAMKKNISFSNSEVHLIADILSESLPQAEKDKVKKIMAMLGR